MSLRAAKFNDHWRRAFARAYSVRYEALNFVGLRSLADDSVSFAKGITAIIGGNGVGKSTLAHAIVDVLAGDEPVPELKKSSKRLIGSELNGTLHLEENQRNISVSNINGRFIGPIKFDGAFAWLDPSRAAILSQQQILGDPNFADLLDGIGAIALDKDQLEMASYVVGKSYQECNVWEIEEYGSFERFPYFQVQSGGVSYGSEDMGQGELSLLYSLWTINDAPKNSILVIEEPETHISSRSQGALMNALARACDTKGIWTIITTHSPVILSYIPKENVRLLISNGVKSRLIDQPLVHQIASIAGGGVAYKALILVEDECAKLFSEFVIEIIDPDLKQQLAFAITGSESVISTVLRNLPRVPRSTVIYGLYDGDQREKIDNNGFKWQHGFLPTTEAPDVILRKEALAQDGAERLSKELHTTPASVLASLDATTGLDHHDWLSEFANGMVRDTRSTIRGLVIVWVANNPTTARELVDQLRAAIQQ